MHWILWVLLIIIVFGVFPTFVISSIIYSVLLRRRNPDKWGRKASMPEDEEYIRLYAQALNWREAHIANKRDVDIENDGLKLRGEYFDFGHDRAVIIIPGRMEACHYSCHYAEPYRIAGWNVLTIDGRAHGLSEGNTNSLGYKEYADVLAWAKMLHDKEHNRVIVLHGICIGSSTALFAATDKLCPDYIAGITVDGLYQRFLETFKNHLIQDHRPQFPFIAETMLLIRLFSHADVVNDGPIFRIGHMRKPILFLHSKEDVFSTPDKAKELFDKCPSPKKQICWFDHGAHSRLRVTDPERYDKAVISYFSAADWQ